MKIHPAQNRFWNACRELYWSVRILICRFQQNRVIGRMRRRPAGQKIRVLFYMYDAAKWKCQRIYDLMKASTDFEPLVLIGAYPYNPLETKESLEKTLSGIELFLDKSGCRHKRIVHGFPPSFSDITSLKPDVVFIQQPWGLPDVCEPYAISRYALPVYVPYYVPTNLDPSVHCDTLFHRSLYAYFVLSDEWAKLMGKFTRFKVHTTRYLGLGHPTLDACAQDDDAINQKSDSVIYAPHFSFSFAANHSLFPIGTFETTGLPILNYAKAHPEFNWIFKPHPVLKDRLIATKYMAKDEVDAYYKAWDDIGRVELSGNYEDLFSQARVMITDSDSFLAEFGATGKPIIHLRRATSTIEYTGPSSYINTYYKVYSVSDMESIFKTVIEKGEDPMKNVRQIALQSAGLLNKGAGIRILKYLRGVCGDAV